MVGKWHLGSIIRDAAGDPVRGRSYVHETVPDWTQPIEDGPGERGFDYWYGFLQAVNNAPYKWVENDRFLYHESVWVTREKDFPHLDHVNAGGWADATRGGELLWDPFQLTRMLQDKAVNVIRNASGRSKPFFLYLTLPSPHVPTCPHPDYQGRTPHEYTDFVAEVDGVVGAVVDALRAAGSLSETLIVFTSDNGARVDKSIYSDHYGPGIVDGAELREGKASLYEAGHRVPYVVRWGDGTPEGSRVHPGLVNSELLDITDFIATVSALVGQPIPDGHAVDSVDMLPTLLGDGSDHRLRRLMITSSLRGHLAIRASDPDGTEWKLLFSTGGGANFGGAAPEGEKFDPMGSLGQGSWSRVQLYNLSTDVGERTNLLDAMLIDEGAKAKARVLQRLYQAENERAF